MKILYITNLPSPYTVEFFNEFSLLCDLTVIYERRSASDRNENWTARENGKYEIIYLDGMKVGAENSLSFSLRRCLKKDFDRVIFGDYATFTSMLGIRYMRKHSLKYVISTDGGFVSYGEPSWKKKLKTYFIGGASSWLSPGGASDGYLEYYGARPEKIIHYPFTSLEEKDIISKEALTTSKDEGSGRCTVIGVGQFIHRKGWDVLIGAVKILGDEALNVDFNIVGDSKEKFEALLKEDIPSNIRIVPFASKEVLFGYYRSSDIFVLPTREDIWGLVVNEAMASGLPVIATDKCNAALALISPENPAGIIVPAEDANALAEALRKLIKDKELRDTMSRNALAAVRGYTYRNMAEIIYNGLK